MKFQAVVFDLFHTLVDPEDYRPRDFKRAERIALHLNADLADFTVYWSGVTSVRNTSREKGVLQLLRDYCSHAGLQADEERLLVAEHEWGHYQDRAILEPRAHIEPTLQQLREMGLDVGLLSIADEREVRYFPASPLAKHFTAVCFSYVIGHEKPALASYQTVLRQLGDVPPSAAVYVGDGGSDELRGAKEAGFGLVVCMKEFVLKNGIRSAEQIEDLAQTADYAIDSIAFLPELIRQYNKKASHSI